MSFPLKVIGLTDEHYSVAIKTHCITTPFANPCLPLDY